ncbi:MAG: DUF898 domain-containing protein [Azoarcus sp.]|nr:DUF898 domain-containing protein [Azoarcus sp.]
MNTENIPAEPIAPQSLETSATEAVPSAQSAPTEQIVEHRFQFTGSGGEYFRIWIVNLLLSILTLGIYSAWAKVRREQYFHRNMLLDGSGFDYHGNPFAILKGRVIAVSIFGVLLLLQKASPALYALALIALFPLIPWLIIRSLIFRCRNASYRGVHFDFHGTYWGYWKYFIAPILFSFALIGLIILVVLLFKISSVQFMLRGSIGGVAILILLIVLSPFILWGGVITQQALILQRASAFRMNHLAFGTSRFEGAFRVKPFVWIYLRFMLFTFVVFATMVLAIGLAMLLVSLLTMVISQLLGISLELFEPQTANYEATRIVGMFSVIVFYFLLVTLLPPCFNSLVTNYIWNNTRLGEHRFKSDQTLVGIFKVALVNSLFMLITLGIYWPWAKVRITRYRAEHTAMLATGSLDEFTGGAGPKKGAYGEEMADIFDFDVGI